MKILVTRPLPGGEATAARLRAMGHEVVLVPLMETQAVAWQRPTAMPAAIMLTSGFAARLADAAICHALPVFAVGTATARAAAEAGFGDVRDGGGTVQTLLDAVATAGFASILHLAGEDRTPAVIPAGLHVETRTVYRARLAPLAALPDVDWALLYSPRTATHFANEVDRLQKRRNGVSVAAISSTTLAAAGTGWRRTTAATRPDEDALLASIGVPCQ